MQAITKGVIAAGVTSGIAAAVVRGVLPTEREERDYKAETGKNILTGIDTELAVGISAASTAVLGAGVIGVAKAFGKGGATAFPVPSFVGKTAFMAGAIAAGIVASHVIAAPIESLGRQIGPTIDYFRSN